MDKMDMIDVMDKMDTCAARSALEREFGKYQEFEQFLSLPRRGVVHVDGEIWEWARHGAGLCFTEQSTGRVVDIHEHLLNLSSFDVWRVKLYLESEFVGQEIVYSYVQTIFNELADDGLIANESFSNRYFRLASCPSVHSNAEVK